MQLKRVSRCFGVHTSLEGFYKQAIWVPSASQTAGDFLQAIQLWKGLQSRNTGLDRSLLLQSLFPHQHPKRPYDGVLELSCFCRALSPTNIQNDPTTVSWSCLAFANPFPPATPKISLRRCPKAVFAFAEPFPPPTPKTTLRRCPRAMTSF